MPTIVEGLPFAEYAGKPGLHSTEVATRARLSWVHATMKKADSPEFCVGRAFHCRTLEPDRYAERFKPYPPTDNIFTKAGTPALEPTRTKEYRDRIAAAKEASPEAEFLTIEDYEKVQRMATSTRNAFGSILNNLKMETSLFFEVNGVECKSRPDGIDESEKRIVELKSCYCAEPRVFAWEFRKWGYGYQMAFQGMAVNHVLGWIPREYTIIATESAPPYACSIHRMSLGWVAELEEEVLDYIAEYGAIKDGIFPGYEKTVNVIDFSKGD